MSCLSGRFQPGVGPLLNVGIAKAGSFAPGHPPPTNVATFSALIDTGASITCISSSVAQAVGLQPMGMRPMVSATQALPVNVYLADLVMPFGAAGFVLAGTEVIEFIPHGTSPFQVLVGRDLICRGAFTMSFDGHFTFCL